MGPAAFGMQVLFPHAHPCQDFQELGGRFLEVSLLRNLICWSRIGLVEALNLNPVEGGAANIKHDSALCRSSFSGRVQPALELVRGM